MGTRWVALFVLFWRSAGAALLDPSEVVSFRLRSHADDVQSIVMYYGSWNSELVDRYLEVLRGINLDRALRNQKPVSLIGIGDAAESGLAAGVGDPAFRFLPIGGDRWPQDLGEFVWVRTKNGEEGLSLLDLRKDEESSRIAEELASGTGASMIRLESEAPDSGSYGGNVEVTPSGVLYFGNNVSEELKELLTSKAEYREHEIVDSSWLAVGHVDEFISTIPLQGDSCGFGLLVSDPLLGVELLAGARERDLDLLRNEPPRSATENEGLIHQWELVLGAFHNRLRERGPRPVDPRYPGDSESINRVLYEVSSRKLPEQQAVARIISRSVEGLVDKIRVDAGCRDLKVIRIPVLFSCGVGGAPEHEGLRNCGSTLPNSVNLSVIGDHLIIPDPLFGPFRESILNALEGLGPKIHFFPSVIYQKTSAGIHCGNLFM